MNTPSRFIFRRVGTLSYEVALRETNEPIGAMWRGRLQDEWHLRPLGAMPTTCYTSRDTAAGVLASETRKAAEAHA